MADIPSYDQWMKETYSLTSARSEYLKKLDEALKRYDSGKSAMNKEALKQAFDRWRFEQSKQGKNWRESVRNSKGAVTNLYRALSDVDKRKLTKEELEAMEYISRAQSMALMKMFEGRTLQFRSSTAMGLAQGVGSKWEKFKTGASSVQGAGSTVKSIVTTGQSLQKGIGVLQQGGKAAAVGAAQSSMQGNFDTIRSKVREFCKELCPGIDPNHIFSALHLGSVEHFATTLAPFMGAISSGGKALVGWIGVAKSAYDIHDVESSRYAFAPQDPEAAFDALIVLMDRDLKSDIAKASVKTGAFTGKLLGAFADAGAVTGPVIGLLEILAEIFQTIIEYVRDYKECQAGNRELEIGALNMDLFKVSPILGCYFLVVQDHSTIINFAVSEYGTENWMFDVEKLIAKIQKALDKARQLINASRLEIPGMSNAKGVVEQNYSVKTGFAKVTGAPGAVKDKITNTLTGWFDNPVKPPKVDRSRIVGISYLDKA
jgi:hypothetical protein